MRNIYHFGTFDVDNYGDLLFPIVLEHRLGNENINFVHCSPTGVSPKSFRDSRKSVSSLELSKISAQAPPNLVVVGGGEIIRETKAPVSDYRHCKTLAYPSLWLGAADLAARHGVPLVVNAPGVQGGFGRFVAPLAKAFATQANYLAIRDKRGVKMFNDLLNVPKARLVYDTVFQLSQVWSIGSLEEVRTRTLLAHGHAPSVRTIAFHFKPRKDTDVASVARVVEALSRRSEALPILIAIGPCHGDSSVQKNISECLSVPHIVLSEPESLHQVAALISGSEFFVGQSMHGFVTAFSYGVPGFLPFPKSYRKCAYLLERLGLDEVLDNEWSTLADRVIAAAPIVRQKIAKLKPQVYEELDQHWDNIRIILDDPIFDKTIPHVNGWQKSIRLQTASRDVRERIRSVLGRS